MRGSGTSVTHMTPRALLCLRRTSSVRRSLRASGTRFALKITPRMRIRSSRRTCNGRASCMWDVLRGGVKLSVHCYEVSPVLLFLLECAKLCAEDVHAREDREPWTTLDLRGTYSILRDTTGTNEMKVQRRTWRRERERGTYGLGHPISNRERLGTRALVPPIARRECIYFKNF